VLTVFSNWGLTEHELKIIPPALARSFSKGTSSGGFGSQMQGDFGRLLMRGEKNSELYGPMQAEYLSGKEKGTDTWIHKNRRVQLYLSAEGMVSNINYIMQDQRTLGVSKRPRPISSRARDQNPLLCRCERRSGMIPLPQAIAVLTKNSVSVEPSTMPTTADMTSSSLRIVLRPRLPRGGLRM
jgi:hypothetical protein